MSVLIFDVEYTALLGHDMYKRQYWHCSHFNTKVNVFYILSIVTIIRNTTCKFMSYTSCVPNCSPPIISIVLLNSISSICHLITGRISAHRCTYTKLVAKLQRRRTLCYDVIVSEIFHKSDGKKRSNRTFRPKESRGEYTSTGGSPQTWNLKTLEP